MVCSSVLSLFLHSYKVMSLEGCPLTRGTAFSHNPRLKLSMFISLISSSFLCLFLHCPVFFLHFPFLLCSWVIISLSFLFCCASPPSIIAEPSCYCWSCGRNSVCCWLMYDNDLHPIELLSSDDVCEDVLVMGHYSSTCCYCFEDECHCHFCSNHTSVLSVFFLGF